MNDLPEGWTVQSLGAVLKFNYGKSLPERARRDGSVSVYGSNGPIGLHSEALVNGPAIIVGRKGSIGEVHYSSGPCWPIDTTYFIDGFGEHLPQFWFWYLKHLQLDSLDRATAIPGLNREDAYQSVVLVPPRQEQFRIVAKLERLLNRSKTAREELFHIPRLVERYKHSILTAAFRGDLTIQWRASNEHASLDKKKIHLERHRQFFAEDPQYESPEAALTDKPPFEIPPRWSWFRAESVCDFITKGTTPASSAMKRRTGEIPYIKVYNLTFNGSLDFSVDPTFISKKTHELVLERSRVFPGDILMNIVGPPLGKISIVPDSAPEWNINQAIAVFRPVHSLDRRFLALWLLSSQLLNWAVSRSKATAGQSNLTLQICRDLPIPLCTLEEQREVVSCVDRAFKRIEKLAAEVNRSTNLLDRLDQATLAKAFRGEFR